MFSVSKLCKVSGWPVLAWNDASTSWPPGTGSVLPPRAMVVANDDADATSLFPRLRTRLLPRGKVSG